MTPTVQAAARTDAGLASELRFSVARLTRRLRSERDPSNPLSVAALSALGVLFREGEMTIGTLAAHERVQPPSMTRTVNCLVEEGYVARRANDADGRQVLIDLTDKGREILLADRRRRDVWLARRLRELTPDERDLLRQAAPILQRLATTD
jgi:DNA-binding MarR family transcriptional regulator